MHSHSRLWLAQVFFFTSLLYCARLAGGAEISVTGGGTALQLSIDAAAPGDVITIGDSASYGPVVISKRVFVQAASGQTPRVLSDPSINGGIAVHVFGAGREGSWDGIQMAQETVGGGGGHGVLTIS